MRIKKMKIKEILGLTFAVGIAILFLWAIFSTLINVEINDYKDNKFCSNKLNIEYSWGNSFADGLYYESIGENYINCCLKSPHLNEEGIYEKYICKGFMRDR